MGRRTCTVHGGGANDDTARFCSACGLDLAQYKEEWQRTGGAGGGTLILPGGNPAGRVPVYINNHPTSSIINRPINPLRTSRWVDTGLFPTFPAT